MENAILYAGVEELNTIKEHVLELEGYQEKNAELLKEETRLEKLIAGKEKEQEDEIESTLKKRKNEITSAYASQIATLNSRGKKVKAKKEKEKGAKVSERISEETAELRDANKELVIQIKAEMKQDKVPGICNNTLFFSLFMPKSMTQFGILLLFLLLAFFLIPCGVYSLFFEERFGTLALAVIYVIDVVLFGGLYLLINNMVKEKHLEALKEIKSLRLAYRTNRKKIHLIQKGIKNDTDESTYGLEQYDEELREVEEEVRRVAEEEKEALTTFENETAATLTADIKSRYQNELDALRANYSEVCGEQKKTEDKVKEFTLMMSKQYEAYLGKDMLTVSKLDRLISSIQKGEAANIGEAIAKERGTKSTT
ncbi:MAG: hypothetical protein ACI4FZ_10640 [Lachnospiraceae bacterium]